MSPDKGLKEKIAYPLVVALIMGALAWAAGVQGSTYTTNSLVQRTSKVEDEQRRLDLEQRALRDLMVETRTDIKYIREAIERGRR